MDVIEQKLRAAKATYGMGIYRQLFAKLQAEFGTDVFPTFLTRYRGNGLEEECEQFDNELSDLTECYCLSDIDNLPCFNADEFQYVKLFRDVFMYEKISIPGIQ